MKVYLENRDYIDININEQQDAVVVAVKAKKDENSAVLITFQLTDEQVDKVVSHLITSKAKIKYE